MSDCMHKHDECPVCGAAMDALRKERDEWKALTEEAQVMCGFALKDRDDAQAQLAVAREALEAIVTPKQGWRRMKELAQEALARLEARA